jgi:hypothetical protein
MDKQAIIDALYRNHSSFADYISQLSPGAFLYHYQDKWTAGQQLAHIVLCVSPLAKVFSMDAASVEQNFGACDRGSRSFDAMKADYKEKLQAGGKAPDRFLPEPVPGDQKEPLIAKMNQAVAGLCNRIDAFTEADLDRLLIPHPLLGNLTLREMLYNAIQHVDHHQEMTRKNLEQMALGY